MLQAGAWVFFGPWELLPVAAEPASGNDGEARLKELRLTVSKPLLPFSLSLFQLPRCLDLSAHRYLRNEYIQDRNQHDDE